MCIFTRGLGDDMSRLDDLLDLVDHDPKYLKICEDAVFLEQMCDSLRNLPFIIVNKSNPGIQKTTPAARQYRECLSQYTNIIRVLMKATQTDESDADSPLRAWVKSHEDDG